LEDSSTNTLENFACTVNKYPELLNPDLKVGFLAVEHHLDRVAMFGQLFSLKGNKLCAQKMLKAMRTEPVLADNKHQEYIQETEVAIEDVAVISQEKRWRKGVSEPEYVTYWLGYVAMAKHPRVMHNVMQRLKDPLWSNSGEKAFAKVGLKLSDYKEKDLIQLAKTDAMTFNLLMKKLQELKKPEYRACPPELQINE
jgi:hypothetical protein